MSENSELIKTAYNLIEEIESIKDYDYGSICANNKRFISRPDLKNFIIRYSALYKGILAGSITKQNFHMLITMLQKKNDIKNNKITKKEATENISNLLSNHFNVDWNSVKTNKK